MNTDFTIETVQKEAQEVFAQVPDQNDSSSSFSSYLLFIPLLAIIFPTIGLFSSDVMKGIIMVIAAGFVLFTISYKKGIKGGFTQIVSVPTVAALGLSIVYLISFFLNGMSFDSLVGEKFGSDSVLTMLILSGALLVAASSTFNKKNYLGGLFGLIGVVLVAFVVQIILFVLSYFEASRFMVNYITSGSPTLFGSWNTFALFAAMSLFASIEIAHRVHLSKMITWGMYLSAVFSILALWFINFDIANLLVGFSTLLYTAFVAHKYIRAKSISKIFKEKRTIVMFVIGILFVGISFANTYAPSLNIGTFLSTTVGISTIETRPAFTSTLTVAAQTLGNSFWFGAGAGNFDLEWLSFRPSQIILTQFWNLSFEQGVSTLLTTLVTSGIIGFIFFLALILSSLYTIVHLVIKTIKEDGDHIYKMIISTLSFITVSAWIAVLFYTPSISIIFIAFIGTGYSLSLSKRLRQAPSYAKPLFAITGIIGVCAVVVGLLQITSYAFVKAYQSALVSKKPSVAVNHISNAASLYPISSLVRERFNAKIIELRDKKANNSITDEVLKSSVNKLAIQSASLIKNNPHADVRTVELVGDLYLISAQLDTKGAQEEFQKRYNDVLAKNPGAAQVFFKAAEYELGKSNSGVALEYLSRATSVKPNFSEAYEAAVNILLAANKTQEAVSVLQRQIQATPRDFAPYARLGSILYQANQLKEAEKYLEAALQLNPTVPEPYVYYAASLAKNGKKKEALKVVSVLEKAEFEPKIVSRLKANIENGATPLSGIVKQNEAVSKKSNETEEEKDVEGTTSSSTSQSSE